MSGQMIFVSDTLTTTYHLRFLPENHSHFELRNTYENWELKQKQVHKERAQDYMLPNITHNNMVEQFPHVNFTNDFHK